MINEDIIIPIIIIFTALLFLALISISTHIHDDYVGIVETSEGISDVLEKKGLHFHNPWKVTIHEFECKNVRRSWTTPIAFSNSRRGYVRILVSFDVDVNCVVNIYKNCGLKYYDKMITPLIKDILISVQSRLLLNPYSDANTYDMFGVAFGKELSKQLESTGIIIKQVHVENYTYN